MLEKGVFFAETQNFLFLKSKPIFRAAKCSKFGGGEVNLQPS